MLALVEKTRIWLAVHVGWKIDGKLPEAIRAFQATEADGVWHLQRGMRRIADPRQKAIVFTHCLEEESHAEEFVRAYHAYSERVMTPATYERQDLYGDDVPPWKTFAFVHVGERDATERFRLLRDMVGPGVLKESLGSIVRDEEGHVDLTREMLLHMGAREPEIRREVRNVRLGRAWEGWQRTGKRFVDALATLLLSTVYYLLGGLLYRAARRKLATRYVEFDNNHVKRLAG